MSTSSTEPSLAEVIASVQDILVRLTLIEKRRDSSAAAAAAAATPRLTPPRPRSRYSRQQQRWSVIKALHNLKQTGTAQEYFEDFNRYTAQLGYHTSPRQALRERSGLVKVLKDQAFRCSFATVGDLERFNVPFDDQLRAASGEEKARRQREDKCWMYTREPRTLEWPKTSQGDIIHMTNGIKAR